MNKKNTIQYSELIVHYRNLFTKKQSIYLEDYFLNDLSFNEVASKYHVSSVTIADSIKRSKRMLHDYETKLHLYKKSVERAKVYNSIHDKSISLKLIQIDKL